MANRNSITMDIMVLRLKKIKVKLDGKGASFRNEMLYNLNACAICVACYNVISTSFS